MPLKPELRVHASVERLGLEAAVRLAFRVNDPDAVETAREALTEIERRQRIARTERSHRIGE